jgi:cobalt/nickel transport system permease protein
MTHAWHDIYRHGSTPAHHLDPRAKLAVGLLFTGFVLLTPHMNLTKGAAYTGFLLTAAIFCRVPPRLFAHRLGSLGPFILLMGLSAWLSHLSREQVLQIFAKASLSIGAVTVLAASVPFPDMLRALQEMRVPRIFILFLAFLYRYGAVLGRETMKLERGWKAHYYGRLRRNPWRVLGHLLSALLIRSYERAERVYAAMLSRGFSLSGPALHVLHFSLWDALLVGLSGIVLIGIRWGHF